MVLLDSRDPYKEERRRIVKDAAPRAEFIEWDTTSYRDFARKKIASYGYGGGWNRGWQIVTGQDEGQGTLTTRLDDDDAITPDFVARVRGAAEKVGEGIPVKDDRKPPRARRKVWQFPNGYRVWDGDYMHVAVNNNAWATLQTPPGDDCVIYDFLHGNADRFARAPVVDNRRAFLWTRHLDTLSEWREATMPIDEAIRSEFQIDWSLLV